MDKQEQLEQKEQLEQEEQQMPNEEQGEKLEEEKEEGKQKQNNWIPRYRLNEKIAEIQKLKNELEEVRGRAEAYDTLVTLLEENPEYANELNQLYQKYFGKSQNESSDSFQQYEQNENDVRYSELQKEIDEIRKENLRRVWETEIQEILQDATKRGLKNISARDIYEIMNETGLYLPKEAYNLLLGRKIDFLRSLWENNLQKTSKEQKKQFPSIPTSGRFVGRPPQSIEEAFTRIKDFL